MNQLEKTPYHQDFLEYYARAKILNLRNIGKLPADTLSGDELQDCITIYDTVWRRYAGFSKVLEQLWYGPESWTTRKSMVVFKDVFDIHEWLYICLVHRLTGSGASFEKDHGYRNTLLINMVENISLGPDAIDLNAWTNYIKEYDKPFFTSKGNQIPPFNKPTSGWDKGGREFICIHAPELVRHVVKLFYTKQNWTIQGLVDEVLAWMKNNGFKQYKFVLTAWVMDMAEYYPELVDQASHCYMGKNAMRSLDLMYAGKRDKHFYDEALDNLCEELGGAKPYDMEDVLCDSIRYWSHYVPKNYEQREYFRLSKVPKLDETEQELVDN